MLLQDYYELGVILTRKRLFTQATKNLEKAKKLWDGEESDLAQVRRLLRLQENSLKGLLTVVGSKHSTVDCKAGGAGVHDNFNVFVCCWTFLLCHLTTATGV